MNLIKSKFKVICIGNYSKDSIKDIFAVVPCPTINIGNRCMLMEEGAPNNIIHCPANSEIILNKIIKILKAIISIKNIKIDNPYGKGYAGRIIASYLASFKIEQKLIVKK